MDTLPLGSPEPLDNEIAPPVPEELSPPFNRIEPPAFCEPPTDRIMLPEADWDVPVCIFISPDAPCAAPEATEIPPLRPATPDWAVAIPTVPEDVARPFPLVI